VNAPSELAAILTASIASARENGIQLREVLRETARIGTDSMLLVAAGMAFFGAVLIEHGASQARQVVGDISLVGSAWFEILFRDLAPTIAGLLAAVRVGAALSAEAASLQVTGQLDALELCSGDRFSDVVLPKLLGGVLALPCLLIIGTVISIVSSAFCALFFYGADASAFLDPALIDSGDITAFAVKSLGFGLAIPLSAVRCGLKAEGGPGGVGDATTRGVVDSCLCVLLLNVVFGLAFFFLKS
jgi:ABC-type transport system involved in resistance to organic solvents, permease component